MCSVYYSVRHICFCFDWNLSLFANEKFKCVRVLLDPNIKIHRFKKRKNKFLFAIQKTHILLYRKYFFLLLFIMNMVTQYIKYLFHGHIFFM